MISYSDNLRFTKDTIILPPDKTEKALKNPLENSNDQINSINRKYSLEILHPKDRRVKYKIRFLTLLSDKNKKTTISRAGYL